MFIRATAAIAALYFVHGAENAATTGKNAATSANQSATSIAITLCMDNPSLCKSLVQDVATQAMSAQVSSSHANRISGLAPPDATKADHAIAVPYQALSKAYPLPPRRDIEKVITQALDRKGLARAIKTGS